jgi:hypothetical protein
MQSIDRPGLSLRRKVRALGIDEGNARFSGDSRPDRVVDCGRSLPQHLPDQPGARQCQAGIVQEHHGDVCPHASKASHGLIDMGRNVLCAEVPAQNVVATHKQRRELRPPPDSHRGLDARHIAGSSTQPGNVGELRGTEREREMRRPASGDSYVPDAHRHAVTERDDCGGHGVR